MKFLSTPKRYVVFSLILLLTAAVISAYGDLFYVMYLMRDMPIGDVGIYMRYPTKDFIRFRQLLPLLSYAPLLVCGFLIAWKAKKDQLSAAIVFGFIWVGVQLTFSSLYGIYLVSAFFSRLPTIQGNIQVLAAWYKGFSHISLPFSSYAIQLLLIGVGGGIAQIILSRQFIKQSIK